MLERFYRIVNVYADKKFKDNNFQLMSKIINRILIAGFTDGDIARCTNNDKIFPGPFTSQNDLPSLKVL